MQSQMGCCYGQLLQSQDVMEAVRVLPQSTSSDMLQNMHKSVMMTAVAASSASAEKPGLAKAHILLTPSTVAMALAPRGPSP